MILNIKLTYFNQSNVIYFFELYLLLQTHITVHHSQILLNIYSMTILIKIKLIINYLKLIELQKINIINISEKKNYAS